ncbi:MAG: sulfate ABC transporter permease [Lachnospiraceae bacterium]|nr:sulfate ABC transporter permease [Lachnospiraceae bacterium]
MLIISFLLLLFINIVQVYQSRRTSGVYEVASATTGDALPQPKGGRYIMIALSVVFVFLMLVMPLLSIIRNSLSKGFGFYVESLSTNYVRSAFLVTIFATVITLLVNTFFGLVASWVMTRFQFKGKQVLATLIDIPFSISPVIAGLSFIMMFGRLGWAYPIVESINQALGTDIQIVFALPGVVLATIFVTFPFVSREIIPVLNTIGTDEEEAAALMGAKGLTIFRKVTFPHIKWALVYGMILCTARALGEFGAVNALSKTRGVTFTLPLEIDALYLAGDSDSIVAAFSVSSILVIIAIVVLVLRNFFEHKEKVKRAGA